MILCDQWPWSSKAQTQFSIIFFVLFVKASVLSFCLEHAFHMTQSFNLLIIWRFYIFTQLNNFDLHRQTHGAGHSYRSNNLSRADIEDAQQWQAVTGQLDYPNRRTGEMI